MSASGINETSSGSLVGLWCELHHLRRNLNRGPCCCRFLLLILIRKRKEGGRASTVERDLPAALIIIAALSPYLLPF
jgi:hypothetical protein